MRSLSSIGRLSGRGRCWNPEAAEPRKFRSQKGTATMKTRRIGAAHVSSIGLGGMPMSIEQRPDEARSLATIHAALDAGVTFIDTADAYHLRADDVGHNESLIAKALS